MKPKFELESNENRCFVIIGQEWDFEKQKRIPIFYEYENWYDENDEIKMDFREKHENAMWIFIIQDPWDKDRKTKEKVLSLYDKIKSGKYDKVFDALCGSDLFGTKLNSNGEKGWEIFKKYSNPKIIESDMIVGKSKIDETMMIDTKEDSSKKMSWSITYKKGLKQEFMDNVLNNTDKLIRKNDKFLDDWCLSLQL